MTQTSSGSETGDMTGQMLGGYKLEELIGEGGSARVYKARHAVTDRLAAVKVIPPNCGSSCLNQLSREAQLTKVLEHVGIVRLFSFGETSEGSFYIVMEWVDGDTLSNLIDGRPLQQELLAPVLSQIFSAVKYAHSRGVVHRDLKPDNIMVEHSSRQVKLIDFGIARVLRDSGDSRSSQGGVATVSGSLRGSPLYMSPEQCRREAGDFRSDIYSLAIIIYQCLSGTTPFNAETPYEAMYKHLHASPQPFHSQDPLVNRLMPVLLRCLSKEPERRIQTVEEMESQVMELLSQSAEIGKAEPIRESRLAIAALLCVGLLSLGLALTLQKTHNQTGGQDAASQASKVQLPRNLRQHFRRAMSRKLPEQKRRDEYQRVLDDPSADPIWRAAAMTLLFHMDLEQPGRNEEMIRSRVDEVFGEIAKCDLRKSSLQPNSESTVDTSAQQVLIVALLQLGDRLLLNDDFADAVRVSDKAIYVAESIPSDTTPDILRTAYSFRGMVDGSVGDYLSEAKWQQRACAQLHTGVSLFNAIVLYNAARHLEWIGKTDKAKKDYEEVMRVLDQQVSSDQMRGEQMSRIACFYQRNGDSDRALPITNRALQLVLELREPGYEDLLAKIVVDHARAAYCVGDTKLMLQLLERSEKEFNCHTRSCPAQLWADILTAEHAQDLGDAQKARNLLAVCLRICEQHVRHHQQYFVREELPRILWALGDLAYRDNDLTAAKKFYARALPITRGEDYIHDKKMLSRIANYATLCKMDHDNDTARRLDQMLVTGRL